MKRSAIFFGPLLMLIACFGPSTENFGSPHHISVANWDGWCGVRTDITLAFSRYFIDQTTTKAQFENQAASDTTAAYDWADLAANDGAADIAAKIRNVALAVGHTTRAVDEHKDTQPSRDDLTQALSKLPRCGGKPPVPIPNAAAQGSQQSVSAEPIRQCLASDINVEMSTNFSTFGSGDRVRILVLVKNTSSTACGIVNTPCAASVVVADSNGAPVWESNAGKICSSEDQMVFQPGHPHDMLFIWNQTTCTRSSCTQSQAPPGEYSAHARLQLAGGDNGPLGSAQFTIAAPLKTETPTPTPHSHSPTPSSTPSPTATA